TSGTMSVRARTAATRAARRAGWSAGGIGRVGSTMGVSGDIRGIHYAASVDGRGRWLLRPDGSIDTGMPITSRRARAGQAIVVRRQPGLATKRPKRPAAERTSLDVIAGPSILSAP